MALRELDLEEQEKLEELKAWWKRHGGLLILVIAAVAIAFAGTAGWRWYERDQAMRAGALYSTLLKAAQSADAKAVREAGGTLAEDYARTLYASMGALAAAHFYFERGELKSAKAQLQWVLERSPSAEFQALARLRLAALLLDEKGFDEALAMLGDVPRAPYAAQFAAMRGDVLSAKGERDGARAAYRRALETSDAEGAAFRDSVQMRLDALEG
ncbi:MAG: tetratricopeptide repeat protein [Burkholderiales bacterium]